MKIFFDVDGVLIDGWHNDPARRRPWDATIEQDLGIRREALQDRLFDRQQDASGSLMQACVSGRSDLKEVLAELLPTVGYAGSVDAFLHYWFTKDSIVNSDVFAIVKHLAGLSDVSLYLATGQEHYRADYLWNDLGFREHFEVLFYSARIGHLKSAPEFYAMVGIALDIGPHERPLFFDDSRSAVTAARNAGWDACLFDTVDDMRNHPRLRGLLK